MYAIIETGGKQYRVEKGDVIDIELLDTTKDGQIEFKQVLFVNNGNAIKIGKPYLTVAVKGQLLSEVKGPKEIAYKYKKRKGYRRKVGHRQQYARVQITDIVE